MSIKVSVHSWCENCPHFSPEMEVQQAYDGFGNSVLCDTTITCKNEDRCVEIKKYLESGINSCSICEGEKKND